MLKYFYIADIGEGLFWFLVVIITIVVQIVKASKKASQSDQSIQQETKGYSSPEEELQNFLKSLASGPRPGPGPTVERPQAPEFRQAISPTPPPIPVRYAQPPQPRHAPLPPQAQQPVHPAQRGAGGPARPAPQKKTVHQEKLVRKDEALETDAYLVGTKKPQFTIQALRVALGSDLITRSMLRKVIALHEIIGPPLALRKSGTAEMQSAQY